MIKSVSQITIRDYNTMERTGKVSQYKKPWNFLPVKLFEGTILKRVEYLRKELNNSYESEGEELEYWLWKTETLATINAISYSLMGVVNLFSLGVEVNQYKKVFNRNYRRRIKFTNENLPKYIKNLEDLTGIKIETPEDITRVKEDLEFRKDKYIENFGKEGEEKKDEGKKVYLMALVLGVCSYLGQSIDVNMTVLEFLTLKDEAKSKMNKSKLKENHGEV